MTQNQIRFQEHLETKRHNEAMEIQAGKSHEEVVRHNYVTEAEQNRTNVSNEDIKRVANAINANHYANSDAEQRRHNIAYESESYRHNVEQEGETHRANVINENVALRNALSNAEKSRSYTTRAENETRMTDSRTAQIAQDMQMNSLESDRAERRLQSDIQRNEAQTQLYQQQRRESRSREIYNNAHTVRDVVGGVGEAIDLIKGGKRNGKK